MNDLDENGVLHTESGKKVPELRLTPSLCMDRSIVIYGPSKTGKTILVKKIMQVLQGFVEQILLVAPSEPTNRSYTGYIDPGYTHYRMYLPDPVNPKKDDGAKGGLRFLEAVWKRQEMMAAIYTRANAPAVLASLFGRLPRATRIEGLRYIEGINQKRAKVIERVKKQYAPEPGKSAEKVKEVNEKFKTMLVLLYKKYIAPLYDKLWAEELSEDERYSLYYLNFNPRLLLIFDDCAAQLKPFFNKEIFRALFYQNRHSFITVVVICQDDTDLPTNLRKNAFISFFTEAVVCLSNFERSTNKFPKNVKQYVGEIVNDVFREKNRKLAYLRDDDNRQNFYHVEAPYPKPFRFGSKAFQELNDAVASEGVTMDKENPYYDRFKINIERGPS